MFLTETTTRSLKSTRLSSQSHCLASVYHASFFYRPFGCFVYDLNDSALFVFSELRVFLFHLPGSVCEFRTSIGGGIHSIHSHSVGEALFVGHLQMFDYKDGSA